MQWRLRQSWITPGVWLIQRRICFIWFTVESRNKWTLALARGIQLATQQIKDRSK